jgi:hypothetical protein
MQFLFSIFQRTDDFSLRIGDDKYVKLIAQLRRFNIPGDYHEYCSN